MAVQFKTLKYKNFLSTGNAGTTIQLNRNTTTLIQGVSGAGKSTIIDALCFGLYGKPFRNINKPALINSINQKQLEVEIEFTTDGKEYRIVRGIKPAKFEIYQGKKMLNQDAAVRDYQKVLEDQILKMTYKTFTQIVILGSTAYTPFMQLTPAARREVIEDILDIGIFSTMNQLLKQQIQETKDKQIEVDSDLKSHKTKAESLKHLIDVLSTKQDGEIAVLEQKVSALQQQRVTTEQDISELDGKILELNEKTADSRKLIDASNQLLTKATQIEVEIEKNDDTISFFNHNDTCPTCQQDIAASWKEHMCVELTDVNSSLSDRFKEVVALRDKIKNKIAEITRLSELKSEYVAHRAAKQRELDLINSQVMSILAELEEKQTTSADIETAREDLKTVAAKAMSLVKQKKALAEQRELQEASSTLLRDTGVKTAIIREYLPIINKGINRYLGDLELFVDFTLDENFNEVIKSRHRDEFTYNSFSEGEKLRIDIAILLTWRYIASLKNSCSTNLLVIDEILVGRLDSTNTDIVLGLIDQISHEGTHVFAIAHHDSLHDKFRSVMKFEKKGDFSVLV
jgi:DNA repair exonuclease SbcCD ATPase subunit